MVVRPTQRDAARTLSTAALLILVAALPLAAQNDPHLTPSRETRLRNLQAEIARLSDEAEALRRNERGLLGELERLGAELRLHRARLQEVELGLEAVGESIAETSTRIEEFEAVQSMRKRYLTFRLRGIYRAGADQELRRFVGGGEEQGYWEGLRYAAFLAERDRRVLRRYREDAALLAVTRQRLDAEENELQAARQRHTDARRQLSTTRRRRERRLTETREDRAKREVALNELRGASSELGRLVGTLSDEHATPQLDVRKFRGLLDWPAAGRVTAGFGTVVHPRFQTEVPHPGLDIETREGTDIVSVFDGQVVFASWMRGYGLTAIVDHGHGLLSIYAHAAVLLIEPGEQLLRGQRIGKVGETGSLRGPFLYFELRVDGRPADPAAWLRRR